jgi:serine/threonine protein kinase
MPQYGKHRITGMKEFRMGGMARLLTGRMKDGTEVVVRELQEKFRFNWGMRSKFNVGLKIRKKIPPHPNLVWQMFTGLKGLTPFEVIPYVNGPSLQVMLIQNHEFVQKHAIRLLLQAAESLKHVHASGFLHLDVKAGNLLVDMTDRANPTVCITDFDLSMPIRNIRPDKNLRYGTFNYMSPEHLKSGQIGVESDIFAFGVLAYNLFTNEMPYPGTNALESRQSKTDPGYIVPPPKEKNPLVPGKISELIMRCLEREPAYRYGDLKILVRDLWSASLMHHLPQEEKKSRAWDLE